MRVLMIARNTLNTSPGGDTVQINSTARYLRSIGVSVDVLLASEKMDYKRYDLMHFFNIIRPDDILPHIVKGQLPFVISTIFVDYSEYEINNRKGLFKIITNLLTGDQLEYLKTIARFFVNGDRINSLYFLLKGQKRAVEYVAGKSSLLLPNSNSEYKRLANRYKVTQPFIKVPNAIDTGSFNADVQPNNEFKDHILCVGRIEGRKNQLNLIKAFANTEYRLAIIGKPSPNHLSYYRDCKRIADSSSNIKIIEHLSHKELPSIYKAARVHVLPSWFETTGLSSLEAAILECNIVVTKKGDTEEYFRDYATYCDPKSIESIKEAVIEAYNKAYDNKFKQYILENYTWQKAAEATLTGYKQVLR